ncbi:Zinc metalloproteinase [Trichostrongylus colubriformis]|uniref:Metalloendopeptidase n=1 Tax=Trichostrongylus colubriformis TaxID=6319 RepID=A0AAN8GDJ7_TRICO
MLQLVLVRLVLFCFVASTQFINPSATSRDVAEIQRRFAKLAADRHRDNTRLSVSLRSEEVGQSGRNFNGLIERFRESLFDGDIVGSDSALYEEDNASEHEYGRSRKRRWAYRDFFYPETIWQTGVPYAFDTDLPEEAVASLLSAMEFWQNNTCVTFRPRTNETQYLFFTGALDVCSSTVGRDTRQPRQPVYIGRGCYAFGVTTHEIGHAIGLFHHQQRYDRDEYVTFVQANVAESNWGNFDTISPIFLDTYGLPYDVGSVMHYGPTEFARNAAFPSLLALNKELQGTMGNLEGPSFLDVEIINRHYQCTAICNRSNVVAPRCLNGGYANPLNCTVCKCPSGFGGDFCQLVASSAPLNCGGLLSATSRLTRLRLRMNIGPVRRQCVYHIRAPPNRRIMIGLQNVEGKCEEGCYTRAVEIKMNGDFRPVGYRYCCQSQSFRRLVSLGRNVPIIFFARNGTLDVTLYFRWVVLGPEAEDANYLTEAELLEVYRETDDYGMDMEILQLPEGDGTGTPGGTLSDNVFEGEMNDVPFRKVRRERRKEDEEQNLPVQRSSEENYEDFVEIF